MSRIEEIARKLYYVYPDVDSEYTYILEYMYSETLVKLPIPVTVPTMVYGGFNFDLYHYIVRHESYLSNIFADGGKSNGFSSRKKVYIMYIYILLYYI